MHFLVAATRSSVSHAKLRQFLILALRVLAVMMLILFLARPLAGGWLGWALRPAPDVILILVDRSASMEFKSAEGTGSQREESLRLLVDAARPFSESSHLVVIDSATRQAQEISSLKTLPTLSTVQPSDTAADIPGLFRVALRWLIENKAGGAEIWLASDLQKSNWRPNDPVWVDLVAQFQALPQRVQIRLLPMTDSESSDDSLRIAEFIPPSLRQKPQLRLSMLLERPTATVQQLPLSLTLNGAIAQREIRAEGSILRFRQTIDISNATNGGWGKFELVNDHNVRNNSVFFAYGPPASLRATIVTGDTRLGRLFQIASGNSESRVIDATQSTTEDFSKSSLIIWQGALPSGSTTDKLLQFAQTGGAVLFFPDANTNAVASSTSFLKTAWGETQLAPTPTGWPIQKWIEEEGPLAKTEEGFSLPVRDTKFMRRRSILGNPTILAAFTDGSPFLTREPQGQGQVFFCSSLPSIQWSELGDGPLLVPMIRRLLELGGRRLQSIRSIECGELTANDGAQPWVSMEGNSQDPRWNAGVYRSGETVMAVNRPALEDEREVLPVEEARKLFASLPMHLFNESGREKSALQGEVWRFFLGGMLIMLFVEGWLLLPKRRSDSVGNQPVSQTSGTSRPQTI